MYRIVFVIAALLACSEMAKAQAFEPQFKLCAQAVESSEARQLEGSLRRVEAEVQRVQSIREEAAARGVAPSHELERQIRSILVERITIIERLECVKLLELKDPINRSPAVQTLSVEATIFFATDRIRSTSATSSENYFTGKLNKEFDDFIYGNVSVSIPTQRKPGELNLPAFWKVNNRTDLTRYFFLRSVTELSRESLFREISSTNGNPTESLLIFVHGFNVTFAEAALRSAQLGHDLSFPGRVMLYSWPSGGSITDYWTDEDSVRISSLRFAKLLASLTKSQVKKIYIVAHSMGTRVVIPAVNTLANHGGDASKISALFLAAADFNQIEFKEIVSNFSKMRESGTNVTLYAASNDFALKASKLMHSYRRVGESDPQLDTYQGLDSVDASNAAPMRRAFGHSYISDSAQVLGDMQDVILNRLPPKDRGLQELLNTNNRGWRIPRIP
jgi:esterase/lipase superfamily enzyme